MGRTFELAQVTYTTGKKMDAVRRSLTAISATSAGLLFVGYPANYA